MIDAIYVKNFKCYESQYLALAPLTLLTGLNGMGKSTIVQAILLLRQSFEQRMLPGIGLLLNGPLVMLGTAEDVLYRHAEKDEVGLGLLSEGVTEEWSFAYQSKYEDVLCVLEEPLSTPKLPALVGGAHYLSAERIGPRPLYEISHYHVDRRQDLGSDGRYAVAYLDSRAAQPVHESLRHEKAADPSVRSHVVAWLGEITPGAQLTTQPYFELNRATVGIGFEEGRVQTRSFSPLNVGFGLSYILPVLVALIASPPGTIVIIENPEAHLHPRGQSAIGRLIALASGAGLQVIVETHSDHVLNGIRLAVKHGMLDSAKVVVHFFGRRVAGDKFEHYVESPRIDKDGRFDHWPEGFFDEWEKSLSDLLD